MHCSLTSAPSVLLFCVCAQIPYIYTMSRYPYETVSKLHPAGTVLEVGVYGVVQHVGIATGYGTVIHASRRYGQVSETSEKQFARGNPMRIRPYKMPMSGSEIVARARGRIGQRYGLLTRNCEHFVSWAISGRSHSAQLGPLDFGRS